MAAPPRLITHVAGAGVVDTTYPGDLRSSYHVDGHPRISIVLQGTLREEAHRQEVVASAASVVVKPADVVHRNAFGPRGARLLTLLVPPEHVADVEGLDQWAWHHAGPVGGAALRLARSIRREPEDAEDEFWSFLATLGPSTDPPTRAVPDWLRRTRERLDDEVADGPSVESLAQDAGVHPVSLARAFRRAFGCSPTAYRRRRRVRAAADLLASSRRPAAEIALAAGFADQSHMCRAVRDDLGLTPGQLRRLPTEV